MKAKEIHTERLILKQLSMNHLSDDYVRWMNDADVNKYLESGGDYTLSKLKDFLKEQEEKDILFWAIHIKESNKHIGNIKIDPIDETIMSGEYGIMIGDKEEWGKGYAKEASNAVVDYCFKVLNLNEITLGVIDSNLSAVKLYENMGFGRIGEIDNDRLYNGKVCKTIRMSIAK